MRTTLSIPFIGAKTMSHSTMVEWIFRIGVGMCFIGHGAFGIITKEAWLPYFGLVGIGSQTAYTLMPLIGVLDIMLGVAILVSPRRVVLLYITVWAVWTAALRPLTGESVWEFVERAGNYGVPLAFLLAVGFGTPRTWFTRIRTVEFVRWDASVIATVLRATTVLLLVGHGMLAVAGANGIVAEHLGVIGMAPSMALVLGGFEIGLAVAAAVHMTPSFFVGIAAWKFGTEMLFAVAGSPIWEVIERGGSYTAPLLLALMLTCIASPTSSKLDNS